MRILAEVAPALTPAPNRVRSRLPLRQTEPTLPPSRQADGPLATSKDNVVLLAPVLREVPDADDEAEDWSSSLQLIREAAARTREDQEEARGIVQRSKELAKYCVAQANATTKAAEDRAEAAEALARSLAQQLREVEARLQVAEERRQKADDKAAELRLWLKRLHDSIHCEFDSLTLG